MKTTVQAVISLTFSIAITSLAAAEAYEGVVTGTNVYVRSGPSLADYPVAKISAPTRVTVTDRLSEEWLTIRPVAGCYAVIHAQYVQLDAGGKIGTILGDNVNLRAAGELRKKDFTVPVGRLNRGERVRIIGRVVAADGTVQWYVLKPPAGVRFYIAAQFVRPADGQTAPPATAPASGTPPPTAPVREELDALKQIRALEKQLVAETEQPVAQRNFDPLLKRAKAISLPAGSRFEPVHQSLMQYIRDEMEIVQDARAADELVREVLRRARQRKAGIAPETQPIQPTPFDLQGVMTLSTLFSAADPRQPRRYVVRNPKTRAIVGYVQSVKGKVDLSAFEEKHVGIRGEKTFDPKLALEIVEAEQVELLEPPSEAPQPPAPVVPAEPAPPAPVEPTEPEPAPMEFKPAEPEPAPPAPVEPEPTPAPAPEAPAEVEPAEPEPEPEPMEFKPAEPAPAPPAPVEPEPEPAPSPAPEAPAEVKPAEPEPEPEPMEFKPAEPQPVPVPAKREPEPEPAPMKFTPSEPEPAPDQPEPRSPAELKPMEIKPMDIAPTRVETPAPSVAPPPSSAKKRPKKPTVEELAPLPAGTTPPSSTQPGMFDVQPTEGDVEVEWD